MGTTLHTLAPEPGRDQHEEAHRPRPRLGHRQDLGQGHEGPEGPRGHHGARVGFEGGQMPMQRRLPKRGFKNPFREEAYAINVGMLAERFEGGGVVDLEALRGAAWCPSSADDRQDPGRRASSRRRSRSRRTGSRRAPWPRWRRRAAAAEVVEVAEEGRAAASRP